MGTQEQSQPIYWGAQLWLFVSAKPIQVLKLHYFLKCVVSLLVRFPQSHRVKDCLARCRLCKMDFAFRRRSLTALHEHWIPEELQLQEIGLRLQSGMSLVNKNCVEASARRQKRQRPEDVGWADVHLESRYSLIVNNVLDAETEIEQSSAAAETLTQSRADKLWICQFIGTLVNGTGFEGSMRSVANLTVTFVHVKQLQERALFLQACQVSVCCVVAVIRVRSWQNVKKKQKKEN